MKLGNPIEIASGVHQLRAIGARVTVITTGETPVVVDAGARGSLGLIASGLEALDLDVEQLGLVVLTHYHPDHSGGLGKLVHRTGARVAAHHLEADIVNGKERAPSPYRNPFLAGVFRPLVASLYGDPVEVDYLLDDQDLLPVGDGIRVVHTPGHTAGSICLYLARQKVLVVGDALQRRFRKLGPSAAAVTRDPAQAIESLNKLVSLDIDVICFGHFPALRRDAQGELRRLVARASA